MADNPLDHYREIAQAAIAQADEPENQWRWQPGMGWIEVQLDAEDVRRMREFLEEAADGKQNKD